MTASPTHPRARLLAAATELIAAKGWTGVSTRTLAEHAGVTPGLVHYHFDSLHALLREAAVTGMRALAEQTGAVLLEARTPGEGLDALLAALDHYDVEDTTFLLFTESYLAAARDPGFRADIAAVLDEFRARIAEWLAAHGEPEPEAAAKVLAAAVEGVMLHRGLDPGLTSAIVAPRLRRLLTNPTGESS